MPIPVSIFVKFIDVSWNEAFREFRWTFVDFSLCAATHYCAASAGAAGARGGGDLRGVAAGRQRRHELRPGQGGHHLGGHVMMVDRLHTF